MKYRLKRVHWTCTALHAKNPKSTMNFQSRSGSYTDASVPGSRIALLRPGGLRRRNEASSWLEENLKLMPAERRNGIAGLQVERTRSYLWIVQCHPVSRVPDSQKARRGARYRFSTG